MKKVIYLTSIFFVVSLFYGCQQEIENWYSETSKFDGKYVVATTCEEYNDDNTSIEDGIELLVYNSASNVADEIWIDTQIAGVAVKTKVKISGNSDSFKGTVETRNTTHKYYYVVSGKLATTLATPNSAGLTNIAYDLYNRITVEEGKIQPKGATTIGGNKSDSFFLKVVLHTDEVTFESYQLPEANWATPGVPSFAWRVKDGSRIPADDWDEHWTLDGYRYTGFPEDEAH
jgi:hypothetical protein